MAEQSYSFQRSFPALAVLSLSGGAATGRTAPLFNSVKLTQACFVVTTAVTVADSTITLNREIKYGTSSSQIAIGVFTVPYTSSTIGDVIICNLANIADTDLAPGEGVSFVTNGASTAGAGWCGVLGYEYAEGPYATSSFSDVTKLRSGAGKVKYAAFTAS